MTTDTYAVWEVGNQKALWPVMNRKRLSSQEETFNILTPIKSQVHSKWTSLKPHKIFMMRLISWNSRFDPPWRNVIETNLYSSSESHNKIHNSKFLHVVNQLCILNWQIMQTYTAKVLSELMKNEHSNPGIFLSGCHFSFYILVCYYCYFLIISFQQILDDQSPP